MSAWSLPLENTAKAIGQATKPSANPRPVDGGWNNSTDEGQVIRTSISSPMKDHHLEPEVKQSIITSSWDSNLNKNVPDSWYVCPTQSSGVVASSSWDPNLTEKSSEAWGVVPTQPSSNANLGREGNRQGMAWETQPRETEPYDGGSKFATNTLEDVYGSRNRDFTDDSFKPRDNNWRNCGQGEHFSREYPEESKADDQSCFNCGELGHRKMDCPESPKQHSMVCYNCGELGHGSKFCPEPAKEKSTKPLLDWSQHPDLDSEAAWTLLRDADQSKDMDDAKEAFEVYVKNAPHVTLQQVEKRMRTEKMNLHLIALEKDIPVNKTNVDPQGVGGKKYVLAFQMGSKSRRTKMMAGAIAASYEENVERLSDAGFTANNPIPVCYNCREIGHVGRDCSQPRGEITRSKIQCSNCETEGHRLRDCPEPRKVRDLRACRNCDSVDHLAAACPEPRKARDMSSVECHECGQLGHSSSCRQCTGPKGFGGGSDCPVDGGLEESFSRTWVHAARESDNCRTDVEQWSPSVSSTAALEDV